MMAVVLVEQCCPVDGCEPSSTWPAFFQNVGRTSNACSSLHCSLFHLEIHACNYYSVETTLHWQISRSIARLYHRSASWITSFETMYVCKLCMYNPARISNNLATQSIWKKYERWSVILEKLVDDRSILIKNGRIFPFFPLFRKLSTINFAARKKCMDKM